MEKEYIWASLFRMSTESSIQIKTPFKASEFTGSQDDQLDAGAWCLGRMGGAWIPAMFVRATESQAGKAHSELLERLAE
jgi:hypothetical protein